LTAITLYGTTTLGKYGQQPACTAAQLFNAH
jgi:hypothetical protein